VALGGGGLDARENEPGDGQNEGDCVGEQLRETCAHALSIPLVPNRCPLAHKVAVVGVGVTNQDSGVHAGIRAGLPFVLPTLALGISFGVLAQPVMGSVAPIVMSVLVFAGGAQFAALGVLEAGGAAGAAISAGLLMNARFLPMGFAVAPSLRGGPLARAAQGQAIVDASFAIASRGDGTFDRGLLLGATIPQAVGWMGGTVIGTLGGAALGDPQALGLDAIFPAFYLILLLEEVAGRRAVLAAAIGAAITLALMPVAPAGLPVIAASLAAFVGVRRR
jgi:predicted branched-subunit amino acid permease